MLGNTFLSRIVNRVVFNRNSHINLIQCCEVNYSTKKELEMKLPERPKKPPTAYLKFCQEHRAVLLRENPNLKSTEIIKKCAESWRTVDSNLKDKYMKEYKEKMEDYAKKYVQYTSKLTPKQKEFLELMKSEKDKDKKQRRLRKMYRETNKPKRPMGAYTFYLMDQLKKTGKPYGELLKDIKGKWAELSEHEKSSYMAAAQKDKERYEKDMKVWEEKMIKEGREDIVRTSSVPRTKLAKKVQKEE